MAGPERLDSVYLDTNAWIVWFNDREANPAIRRVMEWADTGQIQLLVSPLVLVEALGTP